MKKNCYSQAFLLIETIITSSPNHKKIFKNFYLWFKSWKSGKMPRGLTMGIKYIAAQSDCCESTVQRFFAKYPYAVRRNFRKRNQETGKRQTNFYIPQETFIHAMQFMDENGMLEKDRRQQKTWYLKQFRKDLAFVYENVGICDPCCPNLRPNPLLIPDSYRSITSKRAAGSCSPQSKENNKTSKERFIDIPARIEMLDLPYNIKLKLSMIPESIYQSALDSAKYKHKNGWAIRDPKNYVAGQAIMMAKKKGIRLDWPAYYSSLKKYEINEMPN